MVGMSANCFKCGVSLEYGPGARPARKDECSKCRADVHVCLNCKHYDSKAYNQCKESQAERVLDKDRSNFCDYFSLFDGVRSAATEKMDHLKKLDDLFKK